MRAHSFGIWKVRARPSAEELMRLPARHIRAVEEDAAVIGSRHARDDVEERRLAGAVRPDEAGDRAARHLEGASVDDRQTAIALGDPVDGDDGAHFMLETGCVGAKLSQALAQRQSRAAVFRFGRHILDDANNEEGRVYPGSLRQPRETQAFGVTAHIIAAMGRDRDDLRDRYVRIAFPKKPDGFARFVDPPQKRKA